MTASLNGKADAVKVLLAHGADVHAQGSVQGPDGADVGRIRRQCRGCRLLVESGADIKAKSKAGFTPLAVCGSQRPYRCRQSSAETQGQRERCCDGWHQRSEYGHRECLLRTCVVLLDAGADPNAPDPRGSALHTLAWLRKPGADGAAGVGNTPHGPPVPTGNVTALELATKLLDHGANPNVRINWQDKKFDKEGGTMKNPPLIQLGRHYLTYIGATPFYLAAHNGDAPICGCWLDMAPIRKCRMCWV